MNQIKKIKGAIHSQLPVKDLQSLVKEIGFGHGQNGEAKIKEAFLNSGIIDELSSRLAHNLLNEKPLNIIKELNLGLDLDSSKTVPDPELTIKPSLSPTISIIIKTGRAFLSSTEISENACNNLTVHIYYQGHRYESKPALSQSEPNFNIQWNIGIYEKEISSLLDSKSFMHFVVYRTDSNHSRELIGTAYLDMRSILLSIKSSVALEIKDIYDPQLTIGLLDTYISQNFIGLSPSMAESVSLKIKKQESNQNEKYKLFVNYTKQWWNDYLQIRSSHTHRLVKLFVNTESGKRESVTNYIFPIKCPLLSSPRHAARFVSLIPFERAQESVMTRSDIWLDLHTFLSLQKGDVVEHALLLCNLLLGFSLDAFVTLGTDKTHEYHAWVTTVDSKGNATFWESLSGQTLLQNKKHHYKTIGCCFNHHRFFANIQPSDSVDSCTFDFTNASTWKALDADSISSIRKSSQEGFPILPSPYSLKTDIGAQVEMELRQFVASYRQDHGLSCLWDEDLSHLLTQSIWRMEISKTLATPLGVDKEFEMGIVKCIPEGHVFKGFPCQFNHVHSHKIFYQLIKNKSFKEILTTKGDKVRFGIKVQVYPFAEASLSLWVMIAVRFRP